MFVADSHQIIRKKTRTFSFSKLNTPGAMNINSENCTEINCSIDFLSKKKIIFSSSVFSFFRYRIDLSIKVNEFHVPFLDTVVIWTDHVIPHSTYWKFERERKKETWVLIISVFSSSFSFWYLLASTSFHVGCF